MKTLHQKDETKTAAFLDRSLNEWVPRHELAELVPQITKRATEFPTAGAANSTTAQTEVMLAILVYCYAIGIYRSKEIEARICRSQARGDLLSRAPLEATALAQFRRLHQPLIKECLASALFQAFRVKWTKDAVRRHRLLPCDADIVSPLDCEAERRLEIAEAWDLFDQDGVVGVGVKEQL